MGGALFRTRSAGADGPASAPGSMTTFAVDWSGWVLRRQGVPGYDLGSTAGGRRGGWMDAYDTPFLVLAVAVLAQWLAAYVGDLLRRKIRPFKEDERADFGVVLTAALTLLGLIIGFSFAMAVSRYDQRKTFEEA